LIEITVNIDENSHFFAFPKVVWQQFVGQVGIYFSA